MCNLVKKSLFFFFAVLSTSRLSGNNGEVFQLFRLSEKLMGPSVSGLLAAIPQPLQVQASHTCSINFYFTPNFCCRHRLVTLWAVFLICVILFRLPSNHVLTEDIIFREVTPDNRLISRRLLTKTSRAPRWAEKFLPAHMAQKAFIIEDSMVDPESRSMTTLTWNITHARVMVGCRPVSNTCCVRVIW